jgi:hypothetical protein
MVQGSDMKHAASAKPSYGENLKVSLAWFDDVRGRIVLELTSGLEVSFSPHLAEGLAGASPKALSSINISPSGQGLHWPLLDVDLFVPSLLQGAFGSQKWIAAQLGRAGGMVRSLVKAKAARENGKAGGRPPKPKPDAQPVATS